jgi:hypothetical protein
MAAVRRACHLPPQAAPMEIAEATYRWRRWNDPTMIRGFHRLARGLIKVYRENRDHTSHFTKFSLRSQHRLATELKRLHAKVPCKAKHEVPACLPNTKPAYRTKLHKASKGKISDLYTARAYQSIDITKVIAPGPRKRKFTPAKRISQNVPPSSLQ